MEITKELLKKLSKVTGVNITEEQAEEIIRRRITKPLWTESTIGLRNE